jgi:hypothetical protein
MLSLNETLVCKKMEDNKFKTMKLQAQKYRAVQPYANLQKLQNNLGLTFSNRWIDLVTDPFSMS